ncbi:unnamed protein product [Phaedon cochleariae]|uniref:Carboxylic ester hydrolase n=1 Tax=Phaedon cochleariae TaxID=80249 RepID=A0A9P0DF56_PHACE|nr:unnamed protein product [Phaedon cochleariae]
MRAVIVFCCLNTVWSWNGPEVDTPLGRVRGLWKVSYNGKRYSSFEGIPYAKPPIGNLRFEEAVPIDPWPGTWNATKTSNRCMQTNITGEGEVQGNEDCLYLNIYVPGKRIVPYKKYDVLLQIHGGAYMTGSGTDVAESSFVLDMDLIYVAINYRLGVFGFLSTEDHVLPGNNAMKDQVLAMKWVKSNIEFFGGNPDSVTLIGHSAGGSSVHLHTLSPMSRGLFHRAFAGSGVALSPWVIKEKPAIFAKKMAALLGCPTEPSHLLKDCLKTRPANHFIDNYREFFGYGHLPFAPFSPVVEKHSRNPFLTKLPYEAIKDGDVADVPLLISTVRDEGLYPAYYFLDHFEDVDPVFPDVAHFLLDYNYTLPKEKRIQVAKQIKDLYLGPGEQISNATYKKFFKIFSDRDYIAPSEMAAKAQAKVMRSPVYYYYFDYNSEILPTSILMTGRDLDVVSHTGDTIYSLGQAMNGLRFTGDDNEMKDKLQNIITYFVKTGFPSFDGCNTWKNVDKGIDLTYLHIAGPNDMKVRSIKSLGNADFWRQFGLGETERDVTPYDNSFFLHSKRFMYFNKNE